MTAFRLAAEAGVDMIETDVHMTRDGRLILMHDDAVDETTDGRGRIADLALAEIRALNAAVRALWPRRSSRPPRRNSWISPGAFPACCSISS